MREALEFLFDHLPIVREPGMPHHLIQAILRASVAEVFIGEVGRHREPDTAACAGFSHAAAWRRDNFLSSENFS